MCSRLNNRSVIYLNHICVKIRIFSLFYPHINAHYFYYIPAIRLSSKMYVLLYVQFDLIVYWNAELISIFSFSAT